MDVEPELGGPILDERDDVATREDEIIRVALQKALVDGLQDGPLGVTQQLALTLEAEEIAMGEGTIGDRERQRAEWFARRRIGLGLQAVPELRREVDVVQPEAPWHVPLAGPTRNLVGDPFDLGGPLDVDAEDIDGLAVPELRALLYGRDVGDLRIALELRREPLEVLWLLPGDVDRRGPLGVPLEAGFLPVAISPADDVVLDVDCEHHGRTVRN